MLWVEDWFGSRINIQPRFAHVKFVGLVEDSETGHEEYYRILEPSPDQVSGGQGDTCSVEGGNEFLFA